MITRQHKTHSLYHRTAGVMGWMVLVLILVAVVTIAAFGLREGIFTDNRNNSQVDTYDVKVMSFDQVIPASGELEALNKVEVRNKVESRTTIKWIIDEGDKVSAGDELVILVSDEIENRIEADELKVLQVENEVEAAEQSLLLQISDNKSKEENARIKLEMAELEMEKWLNGDVVSKRRDLELASEKAKRNHERYKDEFEQSKELKDQGFISESQYKQDEINFLEAEAELLKVKLDADIYDKYTYVKDMNTRKNDIEQAKAEYDRTIDQNKMQEKSKRTALETTKTRLEQMKESLDRTKEQLEACVVTAPIDGLVVYGTTGGGRWWRSEDSLQIGRDLYPNQLLATIPDTTTMIANVKVHETQSSQIQPEMPVSIKIDAMPELHLTGVVKSIGVMAEQSFGTQVREYTVKILIDGENNWDLKPSMRCKADIMLGTVEQVLAVPLQAVFIEEGKHNVWLQKGRKYSKHSVKIGRSSETSIEILEGLEEVDTVLLRQPDPGEVTDES